MSAAAPDRPNEPRPDEPRVVERADYDPSYDPEAPVLCEICGAEMTYTRMCRIVCRNCGYTRDCSDP